MRSVIDRRAFGAAALGAAGALALGRNAEAQGDPTKDDPAQRKPVLVGANPAVQLFDEAGSCTAYASCWRVDWSTRGSGTAIVLWRPQGVRVVGADAALGAWLAESFVRHFPELEGLPWATPAHAEAAAEVQIDLSAGLMARGGGVEVRAGDVLDVRAFATDEFPLGEATHSLSLVLAPCGSGSISLDGATLPGRVRVGGTPERPSSSAFCTEAEVWRL